MKSIHTEIEKAARLAKIETEMDNELLDDVTDIVQMVQNLSHLESIPCPEETGQGYLRDDEPRKSTDVDMIFSNAPKAKGRFFVVPKTVG